MSRHNLLDDVIHFRPLSPKEELEFRQYAREHPDEAKERLDADTLCVVHPVVRDEWQRMGLISLEEEN
jgi:hypothetical protein